MRKRNDARTDFRFYCPNNPLLSPVLVRAGNFLEKLTGSSALDEYQTQDRNRVRQQVAALYEALRSERIIYGTPPASFEKFGQRIRLSDKVLPKKLGTCFDTSLLMASCLETIGINPIVVILLEHAMVGAWLTQKVYPQMVCDAPSFLLKEMADRNNNIVVIEPSAIISSSSVSFEDAAESASRKLRDENVFLYFIDIHRCRLGGIKPVPQRIQKDGIWTFDNECIDYDDVMSHVNHLNHYELRLEDTAVTMTKQLLWEWKLLDFSLRNNLLNTPSWQTGGSFHLFRDRKFGRPPAQRQGLSNHTKPLHQD